MKYRIGLHLDNDKIGWAVISENEQGEACHLERMGVRFFSVAENPFNGAVPGIERRRYRLTRRRYARIRSKNLSTSLWIICGSYVQKVWSAS